MTIAYLIDKINEEKPNTFKRTKLMKFINDIEQDVAEQLRVEWTPYSTSSILDTVPDEVWHEVMDGVTLLAQPPYDSLYVSYLKAQIDFANEEYPSYQVNVAQHEIDRDAFENWVVRTNQAEVNTFPAVFRNIF